MQKPGSFFDKWARDGMGEGMEEGHWPRVKQAFDLISPREGNFLDVGVGNGYVLKYAALNQFSNGRCLGIDISSEMVAVARDNLQGIENAEVRQGDFLSMDLSGWSPFSMIFSMEVFYYFSDIQAGINLASELLKPGGELWVLVDYYEENEYCHSWPEDLGIEMTMWSKADYLEGFQKAGFTDIRQMIFPETRPHRVAEGDLGTLCTKGVR